MKTVQLFADDQDIQHALQTYITNHWAEILKQANQLRMEYLARRSIALSLAYSQGNDNDSLVREFPDDNVISDRSVDPHRSPSYLSIIFELDSRQ